ncbi:ubiquitin carboxyl-terminal hydrolase 34-like [Oppia nitens]|uniref:ubiquitin carboxyl-terminal hydrolase 34-like n=1 Tax=Oppia nitens TaxID=1686743 RepID=UPI0023DBC083|nr:ubiquitin carboxyl-terminal hydrolase 34-like [Oppia nitens]
MSSKLIDNNINNMCDICNDMIDLMTKHDNNSKTLMMMTTTTSGDNNNGNTNNNTNTSTTAINTIAAVAANNNNNNNSGLNNNNNKRHGVIGKPELNLVINYVNSWSQRHCICCYKDQRNYSRFNQLVQSIIETTINLLKVISLTLDTDDDNDYISNEEHSKLMAAHNFDEWSSDDRERLLHLASKAFHVTFPLYMAQKHTVNSRGDDPTTKELQSLSAYCELSELDLPLYLIRNIVYFCDAGGVDLFVECFAKGKPNLGLPLSLAHAMIVVMANLKPWINSNVIQQKLVSLRTYVIEYLCKVSDKELRIINNRTMFEFIWSVVKEHIDLRNGTIDREGLNLALKYFTSSTLTMRLTGITQINNYISIYSELCQADSNGLVNANTDSLLDELANWIKDNKIIEHIFGPNSHVEVIKQSHVILNFIATQITVQHIDVIWSASQMKHCGRQVLDILLPLIKNLKLKPVLHMYWLLRNMEPKEHTEQTLLLASQLLKYIWSQSNTSSGDMINAYGQQSSSSIQSVKMLEDLTLVRSPIFTMLPGSNQKNRRHSTGADSSSSSGSVDNSDDDEDDDDYEVDCSQGGVPVRTLFRQKPKRLCNSSTSGASNDDKNSANNIGSGGGGSTRRGGGGNGGKPDNNSNSDDSSDGTSESEDEELIIPQMSDENVSTPGVRLHQALVGNYSNSSSSDLVPMAVRDVVAAIHKDNSEQMPKEPDLSKNTSFINLRFSDRIPFKLTSDQQQQQQQSSSATSDSTTQPKSSMEVIKDVSALTAKASGSISDDLVLVDSDIQTPPDVMEKLVKLTEGLNSKNNDEDMSDNNSRASSRLSGLSDKNMADFEGEELDSDVTKLDVTDNECSDNYFGGERDDQRNSSGGGGSKCPSSSASHKLASIAQQIVQQESQLMYNKINTNSSDNIGETTITADDNNIDDVVEDQELMDLSFENVCKPGRTLLWDLLQDDLIQQLADGLAHETEKIFWNTVCWSSDRRIRMKFIEGCLDNLAKNYSVNTSLRLLPKFLLSFQQFRGGMDTHRIVLWADKERNMLKYFFNNLCIYCKLRQEKQQQQLMTTTSSSTTTTTTSTTSLELSSANKSSDLNNLDIYSHLDEIQTRLNFLSFVFSSAGSPDSFRLSQEQIDTLWSTLASDAESADELFNWLLSQVRSRENHGLGIDMMHHILIEKLPQLSPEHFSMMALELLQTLSACLLSQANCKTSETIDSTAIKQLWDIALRCCNTDVSMTAIRHLNSYYINLQPPNTNLIKEEEFINKCMEYLQTASKHLEADEDKSLTIIQRTVILIKTHLEGFRSRYAYNFRRWQLNGDSDLLSHKTRERTGSLLRISCQPASLPDRTIIEMQSTDYVGELRAEIQQWWESLINKYEDVIEKRSTFSNFNATSISDGPLRLLTQGQEITYDFDEKQLAEVGFKDMQIVFVSVGIARSFRKFRDNSEPIALWSLPKERIPSLLLLQPQNFEQLFSSMQQLGSHKSANHIKAQVLSRRVWEIIQLLPTSPNLLDCFQTIGLTPVVNQSVENINHLMTADNEMLTETTNTNTPSTSQKTLSADLFNKLLSPSSPQKLMYSCQIVDSLRRNSKQWTQKFIDCDGLQHLFDIFVSGVLQSGESGADSWNEWKQDCLASLLQLLYQFGVNPITPSSSTKSSDKNNDGDNNSSSGVSSMMDQMPSHTTSQSSIITEMVRKAKRSRKGSTDKLLVPQLNSKFLLMIRDVESMLKVLLTILNEATTQACDMSHTYHTGFWGRAQVVHHTMTFLISWAFSDPQIRDSLYQADNLEHLLKKLVLDDPDPAIRREACTGFYRLCLGFTADGTTGHIFIPQLLNSLLSFLKVAQSMRAPKLSDTDDCLIADKEPYGPGCKDYFWLVCRLVDSLDKQKISDTAAAVVTTVVTTVDLEVLCTYIAEVIVSREIRETRHNTIEDEGLRGLISLLTVTLKHNPSFKYSKVGQKFVTQVFDCLFSLPTQKDKILPKCKAPSTRSAAFDLLVELVKGSEDNYVALISQMMDQHSPELSGRLTPYPWDYWPHDDCRSDAGYVGLTNLGATCYMASCMQHLYMIPESRYIILSTNLPSVVKHESVLKELQKMFVFLLESERKAYNPKSFCKVYTMDHQPLNTGEQKDMTEFFTDLITKLEEMTPDLKDMVKRLFSGSLSNNVVSLDCPHISQTTEEFYTLRCQVADMRNLNESLDEITVKDTLEGDNMYNCSRCGRKVRAEKRACIKNLPKILCFNTMRYTFNMVTMTKEKVNTHFSFPFQLDMAPYLEKNLIKASTTNNPKESVGGDEAMSTDSNNDQQQQQQQQPPNNLISPDTSTEYVLIGVTVHTGTADGGHYYSFIRERETASACAQDKWYLFNDAEVKPFDKTQIATECFGGEMTSKTYDQVTDKFMDFSFEKTNSAYMLFYERVDKIVTKESSSSSANESLVPTNVQLAPDLSEWICDDNISFLRDKSIFEHTYFDFMWQICGYIPQTLSSSSTNQSLKVTLLSARLATSFVLETLIHAKEKPTIASWIELLTKQFNSSQQACEWLMDHLAEDDWWPIQILLRCPNQMVRQLFQRLCIHVIVQLKPTQSSLYLQPLSDDSDDSNDAEVMSHVGRFSCVTRFIRKLLSLISIENLTAKPHLKHLTEYFALLCEFAKQGDEECKFLLAVEAISTIVSFYMGLCGKATNDLVEVMSEDEEDEEEDVYNDGNGGGGNGPHNSSMFSGSHPYNQRMTHTVGPMMDDKFPKPASLDKMITLVALLVEKSRGKDNRLRLSDRDYEAIASPKSFPFLQQQIRDNINLRQTYNLICSLCRFNDHLAGLIINMIFTSITRMPDSSGPFFKVLSMLVEMGISPGLQPFSNLVLPRIWEIAEQVPLQTLEWLTIQMPRNKVANAYVLQSFESWVLYFLVAHSNMRVRSNAAQLLICLVPNNSFRQNYRPSRPFPYSGAKDFDLSPEAVLVIDQIYNYLLQLLKRVKLYADPATHSTQKLTSYFVVMSYCLVSQRQKQQLVPFFNDLWNLFQPKLSEPAIAIHQNKQALLMFWYMACQDCPENVKCIVQSAHVTKNIAFNYILADHDDQEVVFFNKMMLPNYYGLLRLCCQQSRQFTRQLAMHQNIQWAFKNITPYITQYQLAVTELFKLMKIFCEQHPDASQPEIRDILQFKRITLQMYLSSVDARSSWQTLITAMSILCEQEEDRLFVLTNNGLINTFQAFHAMYIMFHEATACHITNELVELQKIIYQLLRTLTANCSQSALRDIKNNNRDLMDIMRKNILLVNSYTPSSVRVICLDVLTELIKLYAKELLPFLVQLLGLQHISFAEQSHTFIPGPYFPRRGQRVMLTKSSVRPSRPLFQMCFNVKILECGKGVDKDYDRAIALYFEPYYQFIESICRTALQNQLITSDLVGLCSAVALESLNFKSVIFPKLFVELVADEDTSDDSKSFVDNLCSTSYFRDYLSLVLTQERQFLNNEHTYQLLKHYIPKIYKSVISSNLMSQVLTLIKAFCQIFNTLDINKQCLQLNGDLRAVYIVFMVEKPDNLDEDLTKQFCETLNQLNEKCVERSKRQTGETPHKRRKTKDATTDPKIITADTVETTSDSSSDGESSAIGADDCLYERLIASINDLLQTFNKKS